MQNQFNFIKDAGLIWSYQQVLDWMENNLQIFIQMSKGRDLAVEFTEFPDGILNYMRQNNYKRTLKNQILIFICTTHHSRHMQKIGKNEVRLKHRGYTIPLPMFCEKEKKSKIKKNWRLLPVECARLGEYTYWDFFSERNNETPILTAQYLGGKNQGSYMVAIALCNDGIMTDHIWFSNRLNMEMLWENTSHTSEIENEE